MKTKIELLDEKCTPERMSEHAVGFDIKSAEDLILYPGSRKLVKA